MATLKNSDWEWWVWRFIFDCGTYAGTFCTEDGFWAIFFTLAGVTWHGRHRSLWSLCIPLIILIILDLGILRLKSQELSASLVVNNHIITRSLDHHLFWKLAATQWQQINANQVGATFLFVNFLQGLKKCSQRNGFGRPAVPFQLISIRRIGGIKKCAALDPVIVVLFTCSLKNWQRNHLFFRDPQSHHVNTKEFVERVKEVLQTSAFGWGRHWKSCIVSSWSPSLPRPS